MITEWQEVLGSCNEPEILHGLDTWSQDFPPNVMQFRTRCKSTNEHGVHRRADADYRARYKGLPKPRKSKEEALGIIAGIKDKFLK